MWGPSSAALAGYRQPLWGEGVYPSDGVPGFKLPGPWHPEGPLPPPRGRLGPDAAGTGEVHRRSRKAETGAPVGLARLKDALAAFYHRHRVVRPATPAAGPEVPVELVCFDMDGVLIDVGSSWVMVHKHFGVQNEASLRAYLNGEFDDREFIRRDASLWLRLKPKIRREDFEAIFRVPPLMPGVERTVETLRAEGIEMAIVSGGVDVMAENVARRLGIPRVAANGFVYDDEGHITGEGVVRTPLNDKAAPVVRFAGELGIPLERVLSVGNSLPDVSMFEVAGRSIAFHPEDDYTRDHATWTIEDGPLDQVLPLVLDRPSA
jgi:phosphoserine phosphatase